MNNKQKQIKALLIKKFQEASSETINKIDKLLTIFSIFRKDNARSAGFEAEPILQIILKNCIDICASRIAEIVENKKNENYNEDIIVAIDDRDILAFHNEYKKTKVINYKNVLPVSLKTGRYSFELTTNRDIIVMLDEIAKQKTLVNKEHHNELILIKKRLKYYFNNSFIIGLISAKDNETFRLVTIDFNKLINDIYSIKYTCPISRSHYRFYRNDGAELFFVNEGGNKRNSNKKEQSNSFQKGVRGEWDDKAKRYNKNTIRKRLDDYFITLLPARRVTPSCSKEDFYSKIIDCGVI